MFYKSASFSIYFYIISLSLGTILVLLLQHLNQHTEVRSMTNQFIIQPWGRDNTTVYGIMITGKDDNRIRMAQRSIQQFLQQTYSHKHLIIINHHPSLCVLDVSSTSNNVTEVRIEKEKHKLTLGDLRNIALQLVPVGAYWFTWDDDDWRDPDLLQELHKVADAKNLDAVLFSNRYDVDSTTNEVWQTILKIGFVTMLCRRDDRILYDSKDSMEDVNLRKNMKNIGFKTMVIDNNPMWYIRVIHTNNTSHFVNAGRKAPPKKIELQTGVWFEQPVSAVEKEQVLKLADKIIK